MEETSLEDSTPATVHEQPSNDQCTSPENRGCESLREIMAREEKQSSCEKNHMRQSDRKADKNTGKISQKERKRREREARERESLCESGGGDAPERPAASAPAANPW